MRPPNYPTPLQQLERSPAGRALLHLGLHARLPNAGREGFCAEEVLEDTWKPLVRIVCPAALHDKEVEDLIVDTLGPCVHPVRVDEDPRRYRLHARPRW